MIENQRKIRKATVLALAVNAFLGLIKIFFGLLLSNISMIADGFDSAMDLLMGGFAYIGTTLATKPADENHLYGHEKIEMFFLLLIAGVIAFTGLGIILQAFERLIKGIELEFSMVGVVIIVISILGKILISFWVRRIAIEVNSASLKASAFNYMTDILSSTLVLIAIISSFFGVGFLDPVFAVIICVLILYGAYGMFMDALNILLDRAPKESTLQMIIDRTKSIDGVLDAHELRARTIGNQIVGDMHILVDPELSVRAGHDISEQVSITLKKEFNAVIVVHLEPFE
ncbi:MAG: cation diffusion facilitator family transporter [Candidatus Hodarchaeales archaeon]